MKEDAMFRQLTIDRVLDNAPRLFAIFCAASITLMSLGGCTSAGDTKLADEVKQLQSQVTSLQADNQQLKEKIASLQSHAGSDSTAATTLATAAPAPAPAETSATTADAPAPATQQASFQDIAGIEGEQAIKDLAKLGLLGKQSGAFGPSKPISRAQYVCWLVAANNIYFADSDTNRIHLAQPSDAPSFVDLPPSHPAYRWIQGLANAGYVVGVDSKHFAPNQAITREQMIAIKAQVDEGEPIPSTDDRRQFIHVSDNEQINACYLGPVYEDYSARTTNNIARIWGNTKVLRPKNIVTRSEAAISISKIGSGSYRHGSAADMLKDAG
jgi:hypothetical protein